MDRQQTWDVALRVLAAHGVEPEEGLRQDVADAFFTGGAPFLVPPRPQDLVRHFLREIATRAAHSLSTHCIKDYL